MVILISHAGVFVYIIPKIFRNLFCSMKTWDVIDKAKVKNFVPNNMESIYPHRNKMITITRVGKHHKEEKSYKK